MSESLNRKHVTNDRSTELRIERWRYDTGQSSREEYSAALKRSLGLMVQAIDHNYPKFPPTMNWHSEDPTDPKKTIRVLTLMLAAEY